jgi:hypothetical protein
MTDRRSLLLRLEAAERLHAPDVGGLVFRTLVAMGMLDGSRGGPTRQVTGLEVTRHGEVQHFSRLAGESLGELYRRAVPSGSWRARPVPSFGELVFPE